MGGEWGMIRGGSPKFWLFLFVPPRRYQSPESIPLIPISGQGRASSAGTLVGSFRTGRDTACGGNTTTPCPVADSRPVDWDPGTV
jgi:hypothetical protein